MEDEATAPAIEVANVPDPFARLPALAERLGVKPIDAQEDRPDAITLHVATGERYDFIDLLHGLLDRIDASQKPA